MFDLYIRCEQGLRHAGLVFGTNFRGPVEPSDFQAILPKRLIHHMRNPEPVAFFGAWETAYALARGRGQLGRQQWATAATLLRTQYGYPVDRRARIIRRGFVTLQGDLQESNEKADASSAS